jgi:tetratricopeptide (TPR) repeat protein
VVLPSNATDMSAEVTQDLQQAHAELRRTLVHGQVSEAEEVGEQIAAALERQAAEDGGPSKVRIHRDSLRWLLDGIVSILSGDNRSGITRLMHVTDMDLDDGTLHFAAWLWITWATRGAGELDNARDAASNVMRLSEPLDAWSRSISLCSVAEIEALSDELDLALEHLTEANELFEETGDKRGMATVWLSQAKILAAAGQDLDSGFAAQHAAELDPDWTDPIIFLSAQSLKEGLLDKVEQYLASLDALGPRPPEGNRQQKLLGLIRAGEVPLWVVSEYLRLHEALPGEDAIGELQALLMYSPAFFDLEEELAWKLIKLGRYDDAASHFNALSERDLNEEVRSSVLLGLGTLASMRESHRPDGARIHAAMTSVPDALKKPVTGELPRLDPDANKIRPRLSTGSHEAFLQRELESVAEKKAVFSGDLQILTIADLLEFLKNGRRTGTLIINSEQGIGAVYVRSGMITSAASPNCNNIGNLLLAEDAITDEQLGAAAAAQIEDEEVRGSLLGDILVKQGAVDVPTIKKSLTEQVYTAVRELYGWTVGQFAFSPDTSTSDAPSPVEIELDPQHVLLDVVRQIDEENKDL